MQNSTSKEPMFNQMLVSMFSSLSNICMVRLSLGMIEEACLQWAGRQDDAPISQLLALGIFVCVFKIKNLSTLVKCIQSFSNVLFDTHTLTKSLKDTIADARHALQ